MDIDDLTPAPDDTFDAVDPRGDWVEIQCPACFEIVGILLDAETSGSFVQDCEVCCRPWQLTVRRSRGEPPRVDVEPV